MLVMVDVDSTLTDSEITFATIAKEVGIPWVEKSYSWFQAQDVGVDRATLSNMFRKAHSRDIFMAQDPYPGAQPVLTDLAIDDENIEYWYVSNRHPQAQSTLQEWIAMHDFPDPNNVLAIKDKRSWITEMKPAVVIDDRVSTMIHARDEGSEVFSLYHNHNCNLYPNEVSRVHICDDWWDMEDQIRRFLQVP